VRLQVGNQPVQISANDLPTLLSGRRQLHFIATAHGDAAARAIYKMNDGILVSERFRSLIGLGAGDSLKLPTPSGPKSFFIAGVFTDYTPDECLLYMPRPLYRRYWHDDNIDGIALYLKPGTSEAALQTSIERRFSNRYQLTLLSNGRIRASALKTFDQTFAVTYALQLIAVLVAAIGIFDTLIALLLERSRELATLRALGASATQIMKMTLIEFGLVGLLAWALGVAAGLVLAWQLIFVINRQFFGWTINFGLPLATLWQSLALAMLAAVGAGVLPAFSAARRNIAEALQTE
jgi:putative ABC transport system permease protein